MVYILNLQMERYTSLLLESVGSMTLSGSLLEFTANSYDIMMNFGMSDSHSLRKKFMKLCKESSLDANAIFFIYFLAARVRRKSRVMDALSKMPSSVTGTEWFTKARNFIATKMVDWVSDETAGSFALIHLPQTNPSWTILAVIMMTMAETDETVVVKAVGAHQVFAQLNIDSALQSANKKEMMSFWNDQVKRRDKTGAAGFDEAIYATQAADKYPLLDLNMKEVKAANGVYTYGEVVSYVRTTRKQIAGSTHKSPIQF